MSAGSTGSTFAMGRLECTPPDVRLVFPCPYPAGSSFLTEAWTSLYTICFHEILSPCKADVRASATRPDAYLECRLICRNCHRRLQHWLVTLSCERCSPVRREMLPCTVSNYSITHLLPSRNKSFTLGNPRTPLIMGFVLAYSF